MLFIYSKKSLTKSGGYHRSFILEWNFKYLLIVLVREFAFFVIKSEFLGLWNNRFKYQANKRSIGW